MLFGSCGFSSILSTRLFSSNTTTPVRCNFSFEGCSWHMMQELSFSLANFTKSAKVKNSRLSAATTRRSSDPPKSSLLREDFEDWQKRWPWMICEPNEKEGKFLLSEMLRAGHFGHFDDRHKHKGRTSAEQAWIKLKRNLSLSSHYPAEALSEPFFRLYHWCWRQRMIRRCSVKAQ